MAAEHFDESETPHVNFDFEEGSSTIGGTLCVADGMC